MAQKVIINPLTRISGFLEIEVYIDNHIVKNAKSSGLLFRGFEKMLEGRPPLDAVYFTERICGICSAAHSISSVLALEDAFNISPTVNHNIVRDIIHGCEFLQNHLRHFYLYTFPDYVNMPQISPLNKQANDYRLPEKINKKLSKHYADAVLHSKNAHKMLAVLGGKAPHNHGIVAGGVTLIPDASKTIELKSILDGIYRFIKNIMIEDVYIISKYYKDYFENGKGYGNFLSFGVFDKYYNQPFKYVQKGTIINGKRYPLDENNITENIYRSWYKADSYNVPPKKGYTKPDIYKKGAYSFVKAPRYNGYAMEVGPLARMFLSGDYTKGISTMDRTIARVLEAKKICLILKNLLKKLELTPSDIKNIEIPDKAYGTGLKDTTRGALGHWISIEDKKINKYSIITPTAWNASPADSNNKKGVIEQSLIGTYVKDTSHPVEIGRIVRSFDPCISCATHIISDKHKNITVKLS